jgi:hypothetical protein
MEEEKSLVEGFRRMSTNGAPPARERVGAGYVRGLMEQSAKERADRAGSAGGPREENPFRKGFQGAPRRETDGPVRDPYGLSAREVTRGAPPTRRDAGTAGPREYVRSRAGTEGPAPGTREYVRDKVNGPGTAGTRDAFARFTTEGVRYRGSTEGAPSGRDTFARVPENGVPSRRFQ